METSVTVRDEPARTMLYLPRQGAFGQIPAALQTLFAALQARGLTPAGPPVGVFFDDPRAVPEDAARWEMRWAVAESLPDSPPDADGVGVRTILPRQLAVTIHKGPYNLVGPAYERASRWLIEHGYHTAGPPEEAYLSEPGTPPDEVRTEVRFPVTTADVARA